MAKDFGRPSGERPERQAKGTRIGLGSGRRPDNVTKLKTGFRTRQNIRRVLLSLLSILLAAAILVAAVLLVAYRDTFSPDRIRRWLNYLNVDTQEGAAEQYSFEAHKSNVYALASEGLAVGSVGGLTVFDVSGNIVAVLQQSVVNPAIKTGGEDVLLADLGYKTVCLVNLKSGDAKTLTMDGTIYCADMAEDGSFCVLTSGTGCKAEAHVYSADAEETYQWKSSANYLTAAALSDDGTYLAAAAAGVLDGGYHSTVQILRTDSEDGPAETDLGGELILSMDWTGDTLFVYGETTLTVLDRTGGILGRFSYDGRDLTAASMGGGFTAAAFDAGLAGAPLLTTVSDEGQILAQVSLGDEVLDLSCAGKYVAVLSEDALTVYTQDLTQYASYPDVSGVSSVLMRADGSVLLLGSDTATLFIP